MPSYVVTALVKNAMNPDQEPQTSVLGTYQNQEEAEKAAKGFSPQVVHGSYEKVQVYSLDDKSKVSTFGAKELQATYDEVKKQANVQKERQKRIQQLQQEINSIQQDFNATQNENPGLMHIAQFTQNQ